MPSHSKRPPSVAPRNSPQPATPQQFELVDPTWLLKALGFTFAVALVFAYVTLCIVFRQTQWQLVLHPTRDLSPVPANFGLPVTPVRFGVDASGQPQLDGWWLPSGSTSLQTALVLHSGDSAMDKSLPLAQQLHNAGLNVLLFDYRGYGHSGGQHPTEALMEQDAASALSYLNSTRSVPLSDIVVYGEGVGASLAVTLCSQHPGAGALILASPAGDLLPQARTSARSAVVPISLLFTQTFPLAAPLHSLATPKLLVSDTATAPTVFQQAADPKMTVELPTASSAGFQQALKRFLDSYAPTH